MSKINRVLTRQRLTKIAAADRIHADAIAHMYFDDWTKDILPFVYRDSGRKFKVKVTPDTQRKFIATLFNVRGPENETPEESLSEFVKDVGQCLILYGGAAYELCEIEENKRRWHVLNFVPYETLKVAGGEVIQTLTDQNGKAEVNRIEKSKVLLIDPPKWIEGGKGFREIIEDLMSLSHQEFSPMKFFEKQSRGEITYFDYSKFREFQDVEILKDTIQSGWLRRGVYSDKMTEFYYVARYLRFKRAQAQLRDYLLNAINEFLSGLEKLGLPKTNLEVEGIPSLDQITQMATDLDSGTIGFKQIIDRFHEL
jgi:hypothetical protein